MGITALWDVIKGEDHSVPIAQLAEAHFKKHGRPLRIAVDEADWRFNNLTAQQVYMIRETSNEPAFQGIEKSMFYRICRLLTLNVQLLFVFDGPGRPWKRGRRGQGKINYEERRLLKELLDHFRIPHHEAPGEAEAECARLQQLEVVDAVFSQDSDTLMFGCSFLVRDDRVAKEKGNNDRSKENTKKSGTSVRVIYGQDIQRRHNFDREGLVLFAMLCGGDYDMTGLRNCGSAMAAGAVRAGLGTSLCQCKTREDCALWRDELSAYFQTQRGRKPEIPLDYPSIKTLDKYNRPKVSTDDQLRNLRGLRRGWDHTIDELKLLELTSSRFNIWGRLYMNWVGPVLLTKSLVARDLTLPKEHVHQIKFTKQRGKKDSTEPVLPPLLKSLAFSPFALTTLTQHGFEGERAGYWTSKAQDPFEPEHTVKAEIPLYLLQKVLPSSLLDPPSAPKTTPRKRKRQAEDDARSNRTTAMEPERLTRPLNRITTQRPSASLLYPKSLKSGRSNSLEPTNSQCHEITRPMPSSAEHVSLLSDSEEDASPLQRRSSVIDLGHSPSDFERAIQLSLQESDMPQAIALPYQQRWPSRSVALAGHEREAAPELFAQQSALRTESRNAMSGKSSDSARELHPAFISVSVGHHLRTAQAKKISAAAMPPLDPAEVTHGPSTAADIRAARLKFFGPDNTARTTLNQTPSLSQGSSPSGTLGRATSRSIPLDIEIIDLT
ncbi:PIN domain-like protein [Karstenula rhodostoma CBS 690.94]|uniref:PIN domain-like protein n=1 Tax=Karstenula rhodostoma CBS 690.94 TaxID=1392251 RepID=A0A9P4P7Y0_9PLEO|nr:PIN domain-like protein [Karstenula rhodostoma CBS 690.94]